MSQKGRVPSSGKPGPTSDTFLDLPLTIVTTMSCCDNGRKILSVEDSYYLPEQSTPFTLTTTDTDIVHVDLDLRSATSWHLNASSVAQLSSSTGTANLVTLTLRANLLFSDGKEGEDIILAQGTNSFPVSTSKVITLARSAYLASGLYRVTLSGSATAGTTITVSGSNTVPLTVVSAQATREALYVA